MKKKYRPLLILLLIGLLLGFVAVFLHREYQAVRVQGEITRFMVEMQEIDKLCQENQLEDAVKKVHLFEEAFLQVDSPLVRVTILPRFAAICFRLGLKEEAHEAFVEGLSLFQPLEIPPADRVNQLAFLSRVATLLQEKELAQKLLEDGELLWKDLTNDQEKGECCFYLALSRLDLGDWEKVREMTELLKRWVETSDDPKWKIDMKPCIEILEQTQQEENVETSETEKEKENEKTSETSPIVPKSDSPTTLGE